ncbi:MAG: Gfo/Idh/MocA family oxidoreductase [Phycisphaerae bacterium]|nr:Gfo/Idh/MocA family oxidoreductase [Phycisphaerae bacterium]
MDNNKPIGLGLIGCGAFGLFCLDTYRQMEEVRPIAVADMHQNVAEDFAREFNLVALGDPLELINMPEVDMVHIATPPSSHHELVLQAVRAGKHVLCEKPLALKTAHADEMLAVAWDAKKIVPVNFVLRYNAVSRAVKAIVDSGVLGSVLAARLTNCAGDTPLHNDHWFWEKSVSGGIFIEHGVHFFDLYRQWLGPGEVIASHTETRPGTTKEDRVMCTVRHENGALASHYHGFDQIALMDRTNHRITCEMGDIWVDGWIPLYLTVDAAVDDDGAEKLEACCPDAEIKVLEEYEPERRQIMGRGEMRYVTKRIRLHYCPNADKQAIYANSVRDLLADQIAFIRNPDHQRNVVEINGREALALAEAAAYLAAIS